jgi:threonine dehydrogenase-like Zn-dependent dehydrogenase
VKALRLTGRDLRVEEVPVPGAAHEALVRVHTSGICNTDLEIVRGYAGFRGTLGHEFVGTVERAEDRPAIVGKRVVGEINAGCGECRLCRVGDARHCPNRTVLGIIDRDGAHAEYLALPSRNLIEVPASVSDDAAVFAEPLAAAFGITERVEIRPETSVAVIGDGKLGLLCAMALKLKSEDVSIIGRYAEKLSIAENVGVKTFPADKAHKVGRRFDVVVEASGSESGLVLAMDLIRPLGTIVLKSTFHGASVWPASRIVVDEISLVGSRCGRSGPALKLLEEKTIDPTPLISEEFPLDDGLIAFDRARTKGVLKVLLRMGQGR